MELPDDARCLSCSYNLRGLLEPRCPECGRAFDPANEKSFSRGRPLSWLVRRLLRPTGWFYPIAALALAVVLIGVTGIPRRLPSPAVDELCLDDYRHLSGSRRLFFGATALAELLVVVWLLRCVGRFLISSFLRRRKYFTYRLAPQLALGAALLLILGSLLLGWPMRIAGDWTTEILNKQNPSDALYSWNAYNEQKSAALRAAVCDMSDPRRRIAGLQLLVNEYPANAGLLREAISQERDPKVLAAELRLIAMLQKAEDGPLIERFLKHDEATVRVAAIDALGMLHDPAYFPEDSINVVLETDPPIDLIAHRWRVPGAPLPQRVLFAPSPTCRASLEERMLGGTALEREAAARALMPWPPDHYKLRYAEWGVWLNDGGQLRLMQSVMDEIPPFVHRTSDPIAAFDPRIDMTIIDKPVIHLTASRPMSVDLEILINQGRPYFAYPMPDDYAFAGPQAFTAGGLQMPSPATSVLAPLDPVRPANLPEMRDGYPFLQPSHRSYTVAKGGAAPSTPFTAGGVRWQSLIVSPEHLPWMNEPPIGPEAKFRWWKQLRRVESSWVSSRGEAERFLYYDGPTLLPSPVTVGMAEGRLSFVYHRPNPLQGVRFTYPRELIVDGVDPRSLSWRGLLIHVRGQNASAWTVDVPQDREMLPAPHALAATDAAGTLREVLLAAGLRPDEAQGLLDAWSPHFLGKEGWRFLLLMPRDCYDFACPMQIRPDPTERVRVGILLTELGNYPK